MKNLTYPQKNAPRITPCSVSDHSKSPPAPSADSLACAGQNCPFVEFSLGGGIFLTISVIATFRQILIV